MKNILTFTVLAFTLAACGNDIKNDTKYTYPLGKDYNMRERTKAYWKDCNSHKECDAKRAAELKK